MPSLGRLTKRDPRAQHHHQQPQPQPLATDSLAIGGGPAGQQSASSRSAGESPSQSPVPNQSRSQSRAQGHILSPPPGLQKESSVASSAYTSHTSGVSHPAESPGSSITPSSAVSPDSFVQRQIQLQHPHSNQRQLSQQKLAYAESDDDASPHQHPQQQQQLRQPHQHQHSRTVGLGLSTDEGAGGEYEGHQRRQRPHQHQHQLDPDARAAARYSTILPANSPLPPSLPSQQPNHSVEDVGSPHPPTVTVQLQPHPPPSERRSARKIIKGIIFGGGAYSSSSRSASSAGGPPPPQQRPDLSPQQQHLQQYQQQQHMHLQHLAAQQQQAQHHAHHAHHAHSQSSSAHPQQQPPHLSHHQHHHPQAQAQASAADKHTHPHNLSSSNIAAGPPLKSANPPPLNTGVDGSADKERDKLQLQLQIGSSDLDAPQLPPPDVDWQSQDAYSTSQHSSPLSEKPAPAQQDWPTRHSSRLFSPDARVAIANTIRQVPEDVESAYDDSPHDQPLRRQSPVPSRQSHHVHSPSSSLSQPQSLPQHHQSPHHNHNQSQHQQPHQPRQFAAPDQGQPIRFDQSAVDNSAQSPPSASSRHQFAAPQGPYQWPGEGLSSSAYSLADSSSRLQRQQDIDASSLASGDSSLNGLDIRPPASIALSHSVNLSAVSLNDIISSPQSPSPTPPGTLSQSQLARPVMAPPAGGPPSRSRAQEIAEKAMRQGDQLSASSGSAPVYRHSTAPMGQMQLPTGAAQSGPTTPMLRGERTPQFDAVAAASSEQDRSSPQPHAQDPAETEKAFKDLLIKYKNVKRLYFDGKSQIEQLNGQVEQLQNAVANQRISQSRTALDDNEYMTRFSRLNGAINNLSFNIRKDWQSVPQWLDKYVSSEAMKTGKQEMTAVGRAVVSRWLVEELFNQCFHPGLEPLLSAQLKEIELSIRGNAYTMHSQEEFDALTNKIVHWRMATLDGLQAILDQNTTTENRNLLISKATTNLTACLYQYLSSPPPPGVEGSTSMIVELAVAIAANLPLESRDVAIMYPLPGDTVQPHLMEVEKIGLPLLEAQKGEGDGDGDEDADRDKNGKPRADRGGKTALPKDNNIVRFAGFVALEVRGRQVLIKAPVWTL